MSDDLEDIALLRGLVAAYSPTLLEREAVEYCVAEMSRRGYAAHIDGAGNAVGSLGSGPNEIVLLGHIDTVPGLIETRQAGDILWGRGSVDAKGPLACFVAAGARVGPRAGWKITVIGAVGEEGDSRGAMFVLNRYHPQMAIIGEPSSWDHITLGYKGSLGVSYTIQRQVAHTSARGPNARELAVDYWNQLVARCGTYNTGRERTFDQLTPSLRDMHSSSDGFCDTAQLKIGLRLPPALTVEETVSMLGEVAGEGKFQTSDPIPAYQGGKNTPLVRAFLAAIRSQGGNPGFYLKTGTADMNLVGPAWGCPALAYGPGDSSLDHTPDEHIQLSEYLSSVRILTSVLERLTANP
jgi:[amino group carrier protein]-lysine/ornithine hydrolase